MRVAVDLAVGGPIIFFMARAIAAALACGAFGHIGLVSWMAVIGFASGRSAIWNVLCCMMRHPSCVVPSATASTSNSAGLSSGLIVCTSGLLVVALAANSILLMSPCSEPTIEASYVDRSRQS